MTTSADESAMLATIAADLEDDTVRLAYADWLDEHEDAAGRDRAELIRVQVGLARRDPAPMTHPHSEGPICRCEVCEPRNRERELLRDHPEWTRWPCHACGGAGGIHSISGPPRNMYQVCPPCNGHGDLLLRWESNHRNAKEKPLPIEWDRGYPGWVTLPTWTCAVHRNGWGDDPASRIKELAKTPPWGVPLRGVRIGEAKPDVRGGLFWWWRGNDDGQGKAGLPSVIFNELHHPRIHTHNGNYYPTERAALDDLAAAVLKFGKQI